MDMDFADGMHDTDLILGLGYTNATDHRRDPIPKSEPTATIPQPLEPSLTLGLSVAAKEHRNQLARQLSSTSPNSALSSFSGVKVENDTMSEEAERVSSKASDEDEEGCGRKKLRLTKEQSALLENKFREHTTLNPKQKQALAKQLNLRPRQVEVWFQNRRARTKLKQTEMDCEVLKKCCETLSNENRRLHKELQELKALKSASPMYMHLPTAITLCPSCER